MSGHSIILELCSGDDVRAKFGCDEGDGAQCHQSCELDSCDEGCQCNANGREPAMKDWGECLICTWLENESCWWEAYEGDPVEPHSGPIEPRWSQVDETWLWKYVEVS